MPFSGISISENNVSFTEYFPSEIREDESGVLFVFETELTAILKAEFPKGFREMTLCYGESEKPEIR